MHVSTVVLGDGCIVSGWEEVVCLHATFHLGARRTSNDEEIRPRVSTLPGRGQRCEQVRVLPLATQHNQSSVFQSILGTVSLLVRAGRWRRTEEGWMTMGNSPSRSRFCTMSGRLWCPSRHRTVPPQTCVSLFVRTPITLYTNSAEQPTRCRCSRAPSK